APRLNRILILPLQLEEVEQVRDGPRALRADSSQRVRRSGAHAETVPFVAQDFDQSWLDARIIGADLCEDAHAEKPPGALLRVNNLKDRGNGGLGVPTKLAKGEHCYLGNADFTLVLCLIFVL